MTERHQSSPFSGSSGTGRAKVSDNWAGMVCRSLMMGGPSPTPPSTPATATTHFLPASAHLSPHLPTGGRGVQVPPRMLCLHELQGDHRGWGRICPGAARHPLLVRWWPRAPSRQGWLSGRGSGSVDWAGGLLGSQCTDYIAVTAVALDQL